MNDRAAYHYPLFNDLPDSVRVLYSMVLIVMGIGYLFAMIQIYEVHSGRDGKRGLSVADIRIAYSGNKADTRLEAALKGPMSNMLSAEEQATIVEWVHDGAAESTFAEEVEPVIKRRCQMCHDGSNPHIPSLMSYSEIKQFIHLDTGVSIGTLVRVSHIHMFGLTFIFAIMGLIFSHAYVRWNYVKSIVIAIPFISIIMDIASWWLTKVSTPFAYVVVIGGALMGLSFFCQWVISFYQLWFFRRPANGVRVG